MIERVLHRLSCLFGDGPITHQGFRDIIDRYASLPLRTRVRIWARLICLQPILKSIDRHVPVTLGRLTDLGCGYGLVSLFLASRGNHDIVGIEASPSRLSIAQQAAGGIPTITFQPGDVARFAIPPSSVILLIDTLFLFSDAGQQEILTRCHQGLDRDGILLIKDNTTVPAWKYRYSTAEEKVKLALQAYGVSTQKQPNYRSPRSWRRLIREAVFKIDEERLIKSIAPYPGVVYACRKR